MGQIARLTSQERGVVMVLDDLIQDRQSRTIPGAKEAADYYRNLRDFCIRQYGRIQPAHHVKAERWLNGTGLTVMAFEESNDIPKLSFSIQRPSVEEIVPGQVMMGVEVQKIGVKDFLEG